jgi:septum site-determining protein MinC
MRDQQQAPGSTKSEPVAEKAVEESTSSQDKNPAPQAKQESLMKNAMTVDRPVRSGQQIYAANADMTVLAPTSAGSEIMADGSIHIYGALRGRVLAGARGNESARIYCQSLQAELVAIAGRYQLLDELDTPLKGKPAMIRLEGEKLVVEAL